MNSQFLKRVSPPLASSIFTPSLSTSTLGTFSIDPIFCPLATSNLVPSWLHLFPAFNYSDLISAQLPNHSANPNSLSPHQNCPLFFFEQMKHKSANNKSFFCRKNSVYISMTSAFFSFTNNNTLNCADDWVSISIFRMYPYQEDEN